MALYKSYLIIIFINLLFM